MLHGCVITTGFTSLCLVSPQQFFIALRLVACAQNGLEVALKSLNVAVPPPKFVSISAVNLWCAKSKKVSNTVY